MTTIPDDFVWFTPHIILKRISTLKSGGKLKLMEEKKIFGKQKSNENTNGQRRFAQCSTDTTKGDLKYIKGDQNVPKDIPTFSQYSRSSVDSHLPP